METADLALRGLAACGLLAYGTLHGALVVWVWRKHEHLIIPTLLFISPVGIAVSVLAALPFVGLEAALTLLVALGVGFLPVVLIVGWAIFHHEGGLR